MCIFFFQAEDGIRDLVRSRGLGDVYKRQLHEAVRAERFVPRIATEPFVALGLGLVAGEQLVACLLYTSDAADERSSVDLGGRRIIKKKHKLSSTGRRRGTVA